VFIDKAERRRFARNSDDQLAARQDFIETRGFLGVSSSGRADCEKCGGNEGAPPGKKYALHFSFPFWWMWTARQRSVGLTMPSMISDTARCVDNGMPSTFASITPSTELIRPISTPRFKS